MTLANAPTVPKQEKKIVSHNHGHCGCDENDRPAMVGVEKLGAILKVVDGYKKNGLAFVQQILTCGHR